MRLTWLLLAITLFISTVVAVPLNLDAQYENLETEPRDSGDSSGWRTWTALKKYFQPHIKWAKEELPKKTPSDIAKDIQTTVTDLKTTAEESKIIKSLGKAIRPLMDWFTGVGNSLKEKTFKDMYGDSKKVVTQVDESVGQWLNKKAEN